MIDSRIAADAFTHAGVSQTEGGDDDGDDGASSSPVVVNVGMGRGFSARKRPPPSARHRMVSTTIATFVGCNPPLPPRVVLEAVRITRSDVVTRRSEEVSVVISISCIDIA